MATKVIEATYPITFHQSEALQLGQYLRNRQSVVLTGMRRVGISNFLHFFLYHNDIVATYIADRKKHLFIPVDLNDLVEREVMPFWVLTHKRIVDATQSSNASKETKEKVEAYFLGSIQSQDLFLTIDSVRKSILLLVDQGFLPTIFFVLFDRMKDVVTPEFFGNLEGLRAATHNVLCYVFTSYRSLDILTPHVFTKSSLVVFAQHMYIKPVKRVDAAIILQSSMSWYHVTLSKERTNELFRLVDGYVRYLHLALIVLSEKKDILVANLEQTLLADERILLQSEELWESLLPEEQEILMNILKNQEIGKEEKEKGKYLWETGFIVESGKRLSLFSPMFLHFLKQREKKLQAETTSVEFTKKEHALFHFLQENTNEVCEREAIIEAVWPEEEELGVSDWAIDRLVARVRVKMKKQESKYEIQTVKTRGYKLILTAVRE